MTTNDSFPTLESLGASITRVAEDHLGAAFNVVLAGPCLAHEGESFRFATGEMHPFGNFAHVARGESVEDLPRLVEPLQSGTVPSAVLIPGDERPEVTALLAPRGFGLAGAMPAMAVAIDKLAPTPLPAGYALEHLAPTSDPTDWVSTFAAGYEIPIGLSRHFSRIDAGPAIHYFGVRRADGVMVATSVMLLHAGVAGIYCVATVPDERGRGLGGHATAEPLRWAARTLGYRVGVLQSSHSGLPVYLRLGFVQYGGVNMYIRMPG